MMKGVLSVLKCLFVGGPAKIVGYLFAQSLIMKVFIGWGWIAVLVMIASIFASLPSLMA